MYQYHEYSKAPNKGSTEGYN